jgi:hypothetical protein
MYGYVGVVFEKSPVILPFTCTSVGIDDAIEFHLARATLSFGSIVAGCQMTGNSDICASTKGVSYGVHSATGSDNHSKFYVSKRRNTDIHRTRLLLLKHGI